MRGFGVKTRIVLVGVIALILCGYAWWLLAPRKPAVPELEIDVTMMQLDVEPGDEKGALARMPLFDPATGGWIVGGKPTHSVIGLIPPRDRDPAGDPHGYGRWLTVRLPDGAGRGAMQAAMRALVSEGICTAAIHIPDGGPVPLFKIRSIADGKGGTMPCRDLVNPKRPA